MTTELSEAIKRLREWVALSRNVNWNDADKDIDILAVCAAAERAESERRKRDAEVLLWVANKEQFPYLSKAMLLAGQVERGEIEVKHE